MAWIWLTSKPNTIGHGYESSLDGYEYGKLQDPTFLDLAMR